MPDTTAAVAAAVLAIEGMSNAFDVAAWIWNSKGGYLGP